MRSTVTILTLACIIVPASVTQATPKTSAQVIHDQALEIASLKAETARDEALISQLEANVEQRAPAGLARDVQDYNAALRQAAFDDSDATNAILTAKKYHAWPPVQGMPYQGHGVDPDTGSEVNTRPLLKRIQADYDDEHYHIEEAKKLYPEIQNTAGFAQFYILTERWQLSDYYTIYGPIDGDNVIGGRLDTTDLHYIELRAVNSQADAAKQAMK